MACAGARKRETRKNVGPSGEIFAPSPYLMCHGPACAQAQASGFLGTCCCGAAGDTAAGATSLYVDKSHLRLAAPAAQLACKQPAEGVYTYMYAGRLWHTRRCAAANVTAFASKEAC